MKKLDGAYMEALRVLRGQEVQFAAFEPQALTVHSKAEIVYKNALNTMREYNLKVENVFMQMNYKGAYRLTIECKKNGIFSTMNRQLAKRVVGDFENNIKKYNPVRICKLDPYAVEADFGQYGVIHNAEIIIEG